MLSMTHGAGKKNTKSLIDQARLKGEQGQFLDDQKAAELLSELPSLDGTITIRIPKGLGRVIRPDGSSVPTEFARVVSRPGGGIKTAYPVLPE